jgi:hypothetical protein
MRMSKWPSLRSTVSSASRGSSAQSLVASSGAGGRSSRWDEEEEEEEEEAMAIRLWRTTLRCGANTAWKLEINRRGAVPATSSALVAAVRTTK